MKILHSIAKNPNIMQKTMAAEVTSIVETCYYHVSDYKIPENDPLALHKYLQKIVGQLANQVQHNLHFYVLF